MICYLCWAACRKAARFFIVRQKIKNVKIVDFGKSCDTILLYYNIPTYDNRTVGYRQITVGCGKVGWKRMLLLLNGISKPYKTTV